MVMLDTRIKLLLFFLINFMVLGLKDFVLGSICFCSVCVLCCLLGQQQKVGTFLPMIVMTDYIDSMTASNGVEAAYMERVYNLVSGPMLIVIAIVTFIGGVLGALLAKALFKKHFQKAGIV